MHNPSDPSRLLNLSRRAFMAAAGGALASLALPGISRRLSAAPSGALPGIAPLPDDPEWSFIQPRPVRFEQWGRITDWGSPVYDVPSSGKVISYLPQNAVLPILEIADGDAMNTRNPLWYRFESGWVYTRNVQVIKPYHMPDPIRDIPTAIASSQGEQIPAFWGEIVVPNTIARTEPSGQAAALLDGATMVLYYGTTHRVVEAREDQGGFLWYKVIDDRKGADPFYVLARHMRMIRPEELEPISPGVPKRIEVNLAEQRMSCFEEDRLVFSTLVSSGGGGLTPTGEFAVIYKMVSRHMYTDPESADPETDIFSDPDYFDLPGVPFNTFITSDGVAIHGTFWHGDYGRPRSHGCLNVTPEVARWIFRWVDPPSPYSALASGSSTEPGTPVIIT